MDIGWIGVYFAITSVAMLFAFLWSQVCLRELKERVSVLEREIALAGLEQKREQEERTKLLDTLASFTTETEGHFTSLRDKLEELFVGFGGRGQSSLLMETTGQQIPLRLTEFFARSGSVPMRGAVSQAQDQAV
jgi:hypothetical protein